MAKVPFRNFLSLIQRRFLRTPATLAAARARETFSPASPPPQPKGSNFTVEFLVKSCGFPKKSAIAASKKFQLDEEKQEKHQSVLELFKSHGFKKTQIAKVIKRMPRVLQSSAEEVLKPKLDFLKENGFVGKLLTELIAKCPEVFCSSLDSSMKLHVELLKSYLSSNKLLVVAVTRAPWLLKCDIKGNIDLLTEEGVPGDSIGKLLSWNPNTLLCSRNRLVYAIDAVKNLGIEPTSPRFPQALRVLVAMNESILERKKDLLRSFGWSTEDILSTLRIYPFCLGMSEENIRQTMDFFVNTMNLDPQTIIERPWLLAYGIDSRLRPRYNILKILESKELIQKDIKTTCFQISDKVFLKNYIIKYADQVPGLLDTYRSHKKISHKFNGRTKSAPRR